MSVRVWGILIVAVASSCIGAGTASAAFPGDNGRIAFVRYSTTDGGVATALPGDTTATPLIQGATSPAWSADGTKIAYVRAGPAESYKATIYVANADGTGERRVGPDYEDPTPGPDYGYFTRVDHPAWSPDGQSLAYDRNVTACGGHTCVINNEGIWRINIDGTGEQLLAELGNDPAWSPDGTKVAFDTGVYFYNAGDIAVVGADGRGETMLTNTSEDEREPNWSPDGSRLAFGTVATPYEQSDIGVVAADGTGQSILIGGPNSDTSPAYSPDGTKLVFRSERDGGGLDIANADGSGIERLAASGPTDSYPDWQPLVGPRRADFKNAAQFCKAERAYLGDARFAAKYGGGANAHGKCVSQNH
jgi:Tol biopolymer transport system component